MNRFKNYINNVSLLYGHFMVWLWTGNRVPLVQYLKYIKSHKQLMNLV